MSGACMGSGLIGELPGTKWGTTPFLLPPFIGTGMTHIDSSEWWKQKWGGAPFCS